MKQSINLYPASCQPQKIKFNFMQLMLLIIACLLSIAIVESIIIHQENKVVQQQQQVAQQSSQLQQQLAGLVVQLQANRPPQSKVLALQKLRDEVASKQRLLGNLQQIDLGFLVSFSQLMRGLSKADIDQVSINQFVINNGKLAIRGDALQSDSVPRWLTQVQATSELKAVAFTGVEIVKNKNRFKFQLSNIDLDKKGDKK